MHSIVIEDIKWLILHTEWEKFRNKKILITGATGSIARYLVYYFMMLNEEKNLECDVYALVRNREKAKQIFSDYIDHIFFHLLIGNVEDHMDYADDINYIFHAAGISASGMFGLKPVELMRANLLGAYNLFEGVIRRQLKTEFKFIFFSSGAVYGQIPDSLSSVEENKFFAMDALNDSGVYAESKRAAELLCYSYWKEYQIPSVIVRIGHTYGPGINIYDGHVYSDLVQSILKRQPIIIRNPLDERPFTYVRDTVWGILLLALAGKSGEAYNVWNARERISIGKLAGILTGNVFKDRNLNVYCGREPYVYCEENKNSVYAERTDTYKIEKLGWNALVGVEEGFYRTVKSFEESGYEKSSLN